MRELERLARNERGAVLPLVAVLLVVLLGCAALAIDVGMLLGARSEGQRAADSAALAAASAYIDFSEAEAEQVGEQRAIEYATANVMNARPIQADEVEVDMILDDWRARVTVRREAVATWFARIFRIDQVAVAARAAARRVPSGSVDCLKPFAMPDSAYTAADYGRRVLVYQTRDEYFMLIGFEEGPPGLGNIQPDIALPCNNRMASISVGDSVWAAPDDARVGQVMHGFDELIASDPDLVYHEEDQTWSRNGDPVGDWRASPRVGNVALYDPTRIDPGTQKVWITNFATIYFHERVRVAETNYIWGYLFPAIAVPDDCEATGTCSPNSFFLRLVE